MLQKEWLYGWVALTCSGLEQNVRFGQPLEIESAEGTSIFSHFSDLAFWNDICEAIEDYPTSGYSLMSELAKTATKGTFGKIRFLVEEFKQEMEKRDFPGWSKLIPGYLCEKPVHFTQTNVWSSLPLNSEIYVTSMLGTPCWDDFMLGKPENCRQVMQSTFAENIKILELRNVNDWLSLLSNYPPPYLRNFQGSPNITWEKHFSIPNWEKVSSDYDAVYIPMKSYLDLAYVNIGFGTNAPTILAGWHPGSLVLLSL